MILDLSELKPAQVYFHMIQTLIPRPIAWVLSEIEQDKYNLAPFSYFNAVCSDPPLIMLSVGKKPDGSFKDTRVNIEQRKDFVVHIAHREVLDELNQSSATLAADISELDQLGLDNNELSKARACPASRHAESPMPASVIRSMNWAAHRNRSFTARSIIYISMTTSPAPTQKGI